MRRWCGELGLGGRLLFLGALILVLLEGPSTAVRQCLARWRTHNVDVDSKGRRVPLRGQFGKLRKLRAVPLGTSPVGRP